MAKVKSAFFCQNCGTQFPKWAGQCTACKEWNTIVEELVQPVAKTGWKTANTEFVKSSKAIRIEDIKIDQDHRISLEDREFDTVLGGGLVPGSLTLLGGEPGIGKSTLLLQIALKLPVRTLYVSGEESRKQIKMRADRITDRESACLILTETSVQQIFRQIDEVNPELVIIDSIQTLHTDSIEAAAGSISQIRASTAALIQFAKETNTPVVLIGHITKDGQIAGPKVLEHMVDTVLQMEGDRHHVYRILRALKNRFGSTAELGIYEMVQDGLRQVANPSEILVGDATAALSGIAIATTMEGNRPLMIEIQALVSTAVYGTPQRSTTGFPSKRLNMLLAVLEKRAGFKLGAKDVFLNITGGIAIDDPGIDLAVVASILSSNTNLSISKKICFAGEIGLAGEVRPVQHLQRRILEAEKLGFKEIFVARNKNLESLKTAIKITPLEKVDDLIHALFRPE